MERRTVSRARIAIGAVLVPGLLLLGQSRSSAQSLTVSTNPPSGAAGVNNSYLTGSGFPAGAITGATVRFGANCAAPSIASTPVTQVTAVGTLRRFQFLIPASLAPGNYKVWLTGTAGTTAFNTLSTPSCSSIAVTSSVQGTASVGAAIINGAVTLVDVNGNSVSGNTASDGTFALSSAGLTPPYLLKVVLSTASGPFPAGTTLYSVSADANTSSHINVNVLTDAMLRTFYNAEGINTNDAFANPTGGNAAPSPTAVLSLANLFIPAVQLWSNNDGLNLTGNAPDDATINLISSPYAAFPPGVTPPPGNLDLLLHQIISETLNPDGSVAALTINGGSTVTETINPTTANDLITLNTTTTDSSTGAGSTSSFSALALTNTLQPVIDGINASLAIFRSIVNSKGSALTGADLFPVYSTSYLNDGLDGTHQANSDASELAGVTITSAQVAGIQSFDTTTNVADIIISIAFAMNGQTETDTSGGNFFRNEGGVWKLYGDQRIGEFFVSTQARTFQGPGGFSGGTFVFAGTNAPVGVVTNVSVAGPTNNPALHIWNNAGSGALTQGAQTLQGGQFEDSFFLLSNNLGSNFNIINNEVPPGSSFTFNASTASLGNRQYIEHTNTFTTETIQFTSFKGGAIPVHAGLGAVVNQTVNLGFTWPATYPVNGVFLFAYIFDGPTNNPASHSCSISSNGLTLNPDHTGTGSITLPANMSACGLNPSVPIQAVQIFLESDGTSGETSLGFLGNFPY